MNKITELKDKYFKVFETQSESGNSSKMEFVVLGLLHDLASRDQSIVIDVDNFGNIYLTRGKAEFYPMLTAHLDTVHDIVEDYHAVKGGNEIYAISSEGHLRGIGGDDKCGIVAILEVLEATDTPIKVGFFRDEEIGCVGSSNAKGSFFNNVSYVVGIDRQGNDDILTGWYDGNVSEEFLKLIPNDDVLQVSSMDTITDSSNISDQYYISSVNLSSGYYHPHTKGEIIHIDDLIHVTNYVMKMLEEIPTEVIYTVDTSAKYANYGKYNKYTGYGKSVTPDNTYGGWDEEAIDAWDVPLLGGYDAKEKGEYKLDEIIKEFDKEQTTSIEAMMTHYDTFKEFETEVFYLYGQDTLIELLDICKTFGVSIEEEYRLSSTPF